MGLIGRFVLIAAIVYLIFKRADLCATVGYLCVLRGNLERGLKWYRFAKKIGKMSFNNRVSYAYFTLKSGDLEEASKQFVLLSMEPLKPDQRLQLKGSHALVFWKQGKVDDAIEMLEEVVAKRPTTASYGSLGYMYAYNGRLTDALEFNQKAVEYNDTDPIITDNLAYTYLQIGEYEKAEETYQKLFAMNPTFPEGYFEYGKYLIEHDRKNEGITYVKQALNCNFSFLSMITRQDVFAYLEQVEGTDRPVLPEESEDSSAE